MSATNGTCALCGKESAERPPPLAHRTGDGWDVHRPTCGHDAYLTCPACAAEPHACPVCSCTEEFC